NNIFWDNRAGNFTGSTVAGIGLTGDPNTIRYWDLGVADGTGQLAPTYSVLQTTYGTVEDNSNLVNSDPSVVTEYNTTVSIQPWRGNPRFVDVVMVTVDATPNALGDYRITASSSARDSGSNGQAGINAPADDIEGNARPDGTAFDIGADEYSNGGGSNGGGNNGGGNNGGVIPFTTALDTFNQRNGALAPAWGGDINVNQFRVVRRSLAQSRAVDGGTIWWAAQNFDANQDAFMTLNIIKRSTRRTTKYQGLLLKFKGDTITSPEASMIVVRYATTTGVEILTQAPGQPLVLQGVLADVTFQNGDQLGARALADGSVLVFKNGTAVGGVNVASGPNPWPYSAQGGRIGVTYNYRAGRFDNFGGNNYEGAAAASVSSLVIDTALGLPAPVVEPESVTGEIEELEEEFELFMPIVSN
ncbi:MAG: hypothetical protein KDE53_04635, partial [Caldilineaceae bacterium]|nr:hypothetical protein [Caldilineaceae bacterium]